MIESTTRSAFFLQKALFFSSKSAFFAFFFFGKLLCEDCTVAMRETDWPEADRTLSAVAFLFPAQLHLMRQALCSCVNKIETASACRPH